MAKHKTRDESKTVNNDDDVVSAHLQINTDYTFLAALCLPARKSGLNFISSCFL